MLHKLRTDTVTDSIFETAKTPKHTAKSYNLIAQRYADLWFDKPATSIMGKFLDHVAPTSLVLDVGCGPGGYAQYMHSHKINILGIDISQKMLNEATKRCDFNKFAQIDMMNFGMRNDTFDGLWACASLVHIPEEKILAVLTEFRRILKNKGVLFVNVPKGEASRIELPAEFDQKGSFGRFFQYYRNKSHFKEYLDLAGFTMIDYFEDKAKSDTLPKATVRAITWMNYYANL